MEINADHPLLISLFESRETPVAALVAAQLLDNALVAAGLVEDARYMLPRLNDILMSAVKAGKSAN